MIVLCLRCSRKIIYRRKFRERRREKLITRTRLDGKLLSPEFFPLKLGSGRMRLDYLFYIFFGLYISCIAANAERVFKELFKLKFIVAQLRCLRCAICYIMTCCISSYSMRSWIDNRRAKECTALKLSWQLISWVAGKEREVGRENCMYTANNRIHIHIPSITCT